MGERPVYHVAWRTTPEAMDVTIRELPIIHLFVPDHQGCRKGQGVSSPGRWVSTQPRLIW
jgi:hypothetical protein